MLYATVTSVSTTTFSVASFATRSIYRETGSLVYIKFSHGKSGTTGIASTATGTIAVIIIREATRPRTTGTAISSTRADASTSTATAKATIATRTGISFIRLRRIPCVASDVTIAAIGCLTACGIYRSATF